ncbi:hypothetical protein [Lichenibacterium dinghuense]|uniref:hypothetical protein n=1 Tax=Lichenibacterium dinghuense TaxID=2895977 RepID=UPI001F467F54|nr:hypothetical protein [Lichenibacterium sp. 6Y81]
MTDRLRAMRRVLAVQDGLKRSADWRLAEAERAAADVEAARGDLARFRDAELPTGALAAAAAAQARRLDARAAAAAAAVAAGAEAMREATARQKLFGRAVEALAREEAAARERRDLERLVEDLAAAASRAPPRHEG